MYVRCALCCLVAALGSAAAIGAAGSDVADAAMAGDREAVRALLQAGVVQFRPNNAIVVMQEAADLMSRLMAERGIVHTTSECTLRAFTCGDVDPMAATPAEIERLRAIQIGHRVDGIVGGLAVEEETPDPKGGLQ